LRRAHAELDQCQPGNCSSFDELFQMVDNAIGGIHGIGPLTVYDTACRIGEYLNLKPEKIYLHAGTRAAKYAPGHLVSVEVTGQLTRPVAGLPTVGDTI
jgi:hypothetical protein